jgi:hypothetical protein
VKVDDDAIKLSAEGMFYADSVAGLLASSRAAELGRDDDARPLPMG